MPIAKNIRMNIFNLFLGVYTSLVSRTYVKSVFVLLQFHFYVVLVVRYSSDYTVLIRFLKLVMIRRPRSPDMIVESHSMLIYIHSGV